MYVVNQYSELVTDTTFLENGEFDITTNEDTVLEIDIQFEGVDIGLKGSGKVLIETEGGNIEIDIDFENSKLSVFAPFESKYINTSASTYESDNGITVSFDSFDFSKIIKLKFFKDNGIIKIDDNNIFNILGDVTPCGKIKITNNTDKKIGIKCKLILHH